MSNVISFTGRLGKDSERSQAGQSTVLKFSVGENVGYGDNKHTNWWSCQVWGKQAESSLIDYLKKGKQVAIHGEVKLRKHEDKIYPEIRVINVELVGNDNSQQQTQQPAQQPMQQGYAKQPSAGGYGNQQGNDDLRDDLPF